MKKNMLFAAMMVSTMLNPVFAYDSLISPILLAQETSFRSEREVIKWVKKEYGAQVLKIKLNRKKQIYRLRILLPNGKVRQIVVSATRRSAKRVSRG